MKKRFRSTFASRLKIGSATIWQLPSIFLLMYCAARDGFFSRVLLEDGVQLPLLLRLIGVVLFGYIRVPGHFFVRAKLRVVTMNEHVIGHALLIRHRQRIELAVCTVQTAYRRCGVGRLLIEDAMFLAGKLPLDALCLPKAHAMGMLLRKKGFVEVPASNQGRQETIRHWRFNPPALCEPRGAAA